jgi:hypothetical protein
MLGRERVAILVGILVGAAPAAARADESGASAWLPGQFASFAATLGDPGFGLDAIMYVRSASASASRVFSIGTFAGSSSDFMTGVGDLNPLAMLKWQAGNHNFMTYAYANVPVGAYDPTSLAGIGLGRWAVDGGLGYTYANDAGLEFSVTAGVT